MYAANLALRFALELVGVAAVAYWGWTAGGSWPMQMVLSLGATIAFVVTWALVPAPKARNRFTPDQRRWIGSAMLILATGALFLAGEPGLAGIMLVAVVVNHELLATFEPKAK